ncbi:hypothetical protein HDG37_003529 [Paraburkholderia sp. MM5384-R2]|nr:hypothetical protein [Paraburkholderia sp. MM5384-R2]
MEMPRLVAAEIEKRYGVRLISPRPPVRPAKIDLNGSEGRRVWMAAARRVMATHAKVLAALAKR